MASLRARGSVVAAAVFCLLGGCSTVIKSENSETLRAAAVEREALIAAAGAVVETKWPKPDGADWGARLVGAAPSGSRDVSENDAAAMYLAKLGPAPRKGALLADAAVHIGAAQELARAAEATAQAVRPARADVSIIEEAIVDFRQTRDIYLATLKTIAKDGEPVTSSETKALKASFAGAIEALSAAADDLADSVERDDTETFAGPVSKFVN